MTKLDELRAEAKALGYALVPIDPPQGLLMSVALRLDHGLGCPGYYDQFSRDGVGHARRLEVAIADARKAHEEIVGTGFYAPEKDGFYASMRAATSK